MEATFEKNQPTNKENEESKCCSESCSCGKAKIKGGGLFEMLQKIIPMIFDIKNQLPTDQDENPFDFVTDEDFDGEDPMVKKFKDEKDGLGGVQGVIKIIKIKSPEDADKFAAILGELHAIRKAEKFAAYRQAFASINNARNGIRVAQSQVDATAKIEELMTDAETDEEFSKLASIKSAILKGTDKSLDAASYRVRNAFASHIPKSNVRLAYTSLSTQDKEPYLLCPKARYQIGMAKPMEISKCRDNCIDSRTTNEGKTVCAYAEWLNVADNQNAVNDRLEVHRNPDNEENLLTLNKNERTKKTTYNEKNYEQRLEEIKKTTEIPEESLEKRLEDAKEVELGHHGEPKESIQEQLEKKESIPSPQKRQAKKADTIDADKEDTYGEQISDSQGKEEYGDETIEEMLADEWSGLSDEELDDVMEVLLRQIDKD